jgi:hypothetical protein
MWLFDTIITTTRIVRPGVVVACGNSVLCRAPRLLLGLGSCCFVVVVLRRAGEAVVVVDWLTRNAPGLPLVERVVESIIFIRLACLLGIVISYRGVHSAGELGS